MSYQTLVKLNGLVLIGKTCADCIITDTKISIEIPIGTKYTLSK